MKPNLASFAITIGVLIAISPLSARSADWPTFAHDNARSYVTSETLRPPLHLQWTYKPAAPPAPGWSLPVNGYGARKNKSNVSYDDSHPAIVVGDVVYFCSSAENCLHAVEADSGKIRWTFHTGFSPRLAPTFHQGNLLFGADDGRVYCVRAEDGVLVWSLNAAPTAETMLGYGRFSSVWPIRTSVLVEDDVAYFTAGLFPSEGVYLYAVDPEDGEVLWQRSVGQLDDRTTLAPQGYSLAMGDSLFVTSRVAPVRFRRSDGKYVPFATPFPERPSSHEYRFYTGGDYAQVWDDRQLVFGRACLLGYDPDEQWTNRYRKTEHGQLKFHWFNARQAVVHDGVVYLAMDDHLLAIDQASLPEVAEGPMREFEALYKQLRVADRLESMDKYERLVAEHGKDHPQAAALQRGALRYSQRNWDQWLEQSPAVFKKIEQHTRWMVPLRATESLILAGDVLYAGGEDKLHALDANSGKLLWEASTESRVRALAAGNGRLVVSTVDGAVRCFATSAKGEPATVRFSQSDEPVEPLPPRVVEQLGKLVEDENFVRGHALVVGGDGRIAEALAKNTRLQIQVLVDEEVDLTGLRKRLTAAGLYGHRMTAHKRPGADLPFAPYLFNLVVDAGSLLGRPSTRLDELFRVTRPLGGTLVIGSTDRETLETRIAELDRNARLAWSDDWALVRRAAIPDTGDWSHNYASPANTSCSEDQQVKGPFGLLWYGEPGPRQRIDRHATGPMPLVVDGVLYTVGYDLVMAYDVYNGVKYWEREIPGATRTHLPMATSNIAADGTGLYLVVDNKSCWRLDAATGKTLKKFAVPERDDDSSAAYWGWLARRGQRLYGTRAMQDERGRMDDKHSDELFAWNLKTGELAWRRRIGKVEHDGIAIGGKLLLYVDQVLSQEEQATATATIPRDQEKVPSRPKVDRRGNPIPPDLRKLVALDAATGEVKWQRPFDASDVTLDDNAVLDGRSAVACMVKDGVIVVHGTGSLGHPHRQFLEGEFARRALYAFSASDGEFLWGGRKGYRKRPIVVGDFVYAEPFAWNLRTGEPKSIFNPLSDESQPLDFHRGYIGCSHLLASGSALFGNKNGIAYCNLDSREGFSAFRGMSLACGLGATPANGVFVAPEGRSGCTCAASGIHTSIALYPRTFARDWADGVTGGLAEVATFPVQHAYINLGAPGYREDEKERLWMPYPSRSSDNGYTGGWLPRYQHDRSMCYYHSPEVVKVAGHELPWLFTSGYHGTKDLAFQLQEADAPAAAYRVTLHFAELEDVRPGERVFDVVLQGEKLLDGFDVVAQAGGPRRAVSRVLRGVSVDQHLKIGLVPAAGSKTPILSAISIEKE